MANPFEFRQDLGHQSSLEALLDEVVDMKSKERLLLHRQEERAHRAFQDFVCRDDRNTFSLLITINVIVNARAKTDRRVSAMKILDDDHFTFLPYLSLSLSELE